MRGGHRIEQQRHVSHGGTGIGENFDALRGEVRRGKERPVIVAADLAGTAVGHGPVTDGLAAWAEGTGRRRAARQDQGGLRFAFYGRVSTEDWQDPVTSRARQRDQAAALVAGRGRIVAEFFDTGYSRTRAFYGGQYASMVPLFEHYGI
jgi:hypothetical protein